MQLTTISALHFSFTELAEILGRCFQNYFVPFSLTPEAFALRFSAEGMSVEDSCVWLQNGEPVAIAIIARRDSLARLAAFAIVPALRGKGLARRMLAPLFAALKAKGVTRCYLEVIAENHAGIALYHSLGFRDAQALYGFKGLATEHAQGVELHSATLDSLYRALFSAPPEIIPWQLDPLALRSLPCSVLNTVQGSWAAITTHGPAPQLRYLFVEPGSRGKGEARRLLQTLSEQYPGISTPVSVPERFTPLFLAAGYAQMEIAQREMMRDHACE